MNSLIKGYWALWVVFFSEFSGGLAPQSQVKVRWSVQVALAVGPWGCPNNRGTLFGSSVYGNPITWGLYEGYPKTQNPPSGLRCFSERQGEEGAQDDPARCPRHDGC